MNCLSEVFEGKQSQQFTIHLNFRMKVKSRSHDFSLEGAMIRLQQAVSRWAFLIRLLRFLLRAFKMHSVTSVSRYSVRLETHHPSSATWLPYPRLRIVFLKDFRIEKNAGSLAHSSSCNSIAGKSQIKSHSAALINFVFLISFHPRKLIGAKINIV